jgi:hypothetical protein
MRKKEINNMDLVNVIPFIAAPIIFLTLFIKLNTEMWPFELYRSLKNKEPVADEGNTTEQQKGT